MNVLEFYVFDGQKWLADDEHTWTPDFHSAAAFNDSKLAQDVGERERGTDRTIYVMGCLGWQ